MNCVFVEVVLRFPLNKRTDNYNKWDSIQFLKVDMIINVREQIQQIKFATIFKHFEDIFPFPLKWNGKREGVGLARCSPLSHVPTPMRCL